MADARPTGRGPDSIFNHHGPPTPEMKAGRPAPADKDLDAGPKVGEMGEFLPSAYKKTRVHGDTKHIVIRQDF